MEAFKPLIAASDSLLAALIIVTVIQLLWFAGIHGSGVAESVYTPLLLANLAANQAAFAAGETIPHILTTPVLMSFVYVGGAGGTLGLVLLMRRSKAIHAKTIGQMSLIPSIFNINEPVIFGTPIVMNPIFFIPWMLAPIINTFIVWGAFSTGFVHKVVALAPWTVPAPIAASLSTGWSTTAPIIVFITFTVSFFAYIPFFKMYEKQLLAEEFAASK